MSRFLTDRVCHDVQISGSTLHEAASDDEQKRACHENGNWNISKSSIKRRRQGRRQAGIQNTFNAEFEASDNPPRGIDNRGDAGVGGANHRQAFLDGTQPRL